MKVISQILTLFFAAMIIGSCEPSNEKRISDLSRTVDSLKQALEEIKNKIPADTGGSSYPKANYSVNGYQSTVFAFCNIKYKYIDVISNYNRTYDTTIVKSIISEIHEIENNPDAQYKLLDQFEKEIRNSNFSRSLMILDRVPYTYNNYGSASIAREKMIRY
jgi:hypothetical protein